MAYPLMLASLAVSAAGAGASMAASAESAERMEKTRAAFIARQKELQEQASTVFQQSAAKQTKGAAESSLAKGADQRGQLASVLKMATSAQTGTALPGNSSKSYDVADTAGHAARTQQSNATNRLQAYGDWTGETARNNAEAQAQMAPIASKSRGNAGILPAQMDAASHAGDEIGNWGRVLSAIGAAGGMAAGAGVGSGQAATVTPMSQVGQYPMADQMLQGVQQSQAIGNWATGPSLWSRLY